MNPLEQRITSIKWDIEFNEGMMKELKRKMQDILESNDSHIALFIVGQAQEFKELHEKNRQLDMELKALMRIKEHFEEQ